MNIDHNKNARTWLVAESQLKRGLVAHIMLLFCEICLQWYLVPASSESSDFGHSNSIWLGLLRYLFRRLYCNVSSGLSFICPPHWVSRCSRRQRKDYGGASLDQTSIQVYEAIKIFLTLYKICRKSN